MSDDGRAGATAPTTTAVTDAAVVHARTVLDLYHDGDHFEDAVREGLRRAFPVMLAAWIAGLTDTQLDEVTVDLESAMHHGWPHSATVLRAALTRLGGAHE